MSEITVDPRQLRSAAARVEAGLEVAHQMVASAGTARDMARTAGLPQAVSAIESFAQRWSYGLRCMNDDMGRTAAMLERAAAAYANVDEEVGRAASH